MNQEDYKNCIAIIGISGYFPKARNTEEFWERLVNGTECISQFTEDELLDAGEDAELLKDSNYVRAKGIIDNPEAFDTNFFGISPAEATSMDPQQRLFLECSWSAIEDSGINLDTASKSIGVFGSQGWSTYLLNSISKNPNFMRNHNSYQLMLGNDKDYLSSRVSFKLNLTGPSVTVQTACSSSLVAVHMACESLLNGECDMALAGGVSVSFPHKRGYIYQKGMILSPDGHCRPFDKNAEGTVEGTGVGVVLLKRLDEAINDKDRIYAVIRGSAVNNDGSEKIGYTAPSVQQQSAVISEAMDIAGVDPSEISYVETHGTGTPLGDPIEIMALKKAFNERTDSVGYCAIGSLKSNIGHLNTASGISGLIKVALSLQNECIPASLNFSSPSLEIDFEKSPFFVNTQTRQWKRGEKPRLAGISSFGIGGTNVHMILEEAPIPFKAMPSNRQCHVLTISAKTRESVMNYSKELGKFLKSTNDIDIADVAFTLQTGRQEFEYRRAVTCTTYEEAIAQLSDDSSKICFTDHRARMVFMFSGQGSQHIGMSRELYISEPKYKREFDKCCEILRPYLSGIDIRNLIFAQSSDAEKAALELQNTAMAQPAIFVLEYSLARLLISWGMEPLAMLGHSIGEYVAATLSGVMSLNGALELVAARGRLIQELPKGAMLSVALSEKDLLERLKNEPNLDIAAINSRSSCVISGPTSAIEVFKQTLDCEGVSCTKLHTSHAFHSAMMEPILSTFAEVVNRIQLSPPRSPIMSCVTGKWMTNEQACSIGYWVRHLRNTVRFDSMIKFLEEEGFSHFVEVGPGRTLSSLARQNLKSASTVHLLPSIRESQGDVAQLMGAIGQLWSDGIHINWCLIYEEEIRAKVKLPLYCFERQLYTLESEKTSTIMNSDIQKPEFIQKTFSGRDHIKTEYIPPENELEMVIAKIWEEVLQIYPIGRTDNFFDLGGDSLMGIELLGRIKAIFMVDIPVSEIFKTPNIEGLALNVLERIENLTEEEVAAIENLLDAVTEEGNNANE